MNLTENRTILAIISALFTLILMSSGNVYAHCDTLDGPVVAEARTALASGDVIPLLKWVSPEEEENIRDAFKRTLEVRKLGDEAKQLVDMYFFETLVRIHRAGEGAPYTGLKHSTSIDPAVALADNAIESGSVNKLANVLTQALDKGLREKFKQVMKTRQYADESVTTGREFVEAYVQFTHYAEGIHVLLKEDSSHHEHP